MRKIVQLSIFLLFVSSVVIAQPKEEREIAALVEIFNKALVDADTTALKNITANELSYGHSTAKVQNKKEFITDVATGADFLSINTSDQTIKIASNNAIVRHIFSASLSNNGIKTNVRIGNLMVWQKQKGKWKLLARQAYKL